VRLSVSRSFQEQAAEIRNVLNVGIEDQSSWGNDEEALRNWRRLVEESGIFVFKDAFKQKDISGFCLHDDGFPVIYLNNSTTKTRQIFSLLHEVAHLLFGQNGLSKFDADYIYGLSSSQQRIEVMCNSLAAEILIPAHDFAEQVKSLPLQGDELPDAVYARLARRYGVSREAVLRRFLDSGRVSQRFYETKAKKWNKQKKEKGGKGDWYASKGAYLSDKFLKDVYKKHYRNQLTVEQASDLLGIKAKNFGGMEKLVLSRGVA
jgi:Zn-dependent peptidase ImmA (M78 family)